MEGVKVLRGGRGKSPSEKNLVRRKNPTGRPLHGERLKKKIKEGRGGGEKGG